jgi:hypothetical protein
MPHSPADRHAMRLLAAVYADRGMTGAAIGRAVDVSPTTAREWIAAGRRAWVANPQGCRRELYAFLGGLISRERVDALLAVVPPTAGTVK